MRYLMRLLGLKTGPDIPPPPPPDQWEQLELQRALRDLEVAESHFREASDPRAIDVAAYRLKLAQARVLLALGRHDAPQDHPVPWLADGTEGPDGPDGPEGSAGPKDPYESGDPKSRDHP